MCEMKRPFATLRAERKHEASRFWTAAPVIAILELLVETFEGIPGVVDASQHCVESSTTAVDEGVVQLAALIPPCADRYR